MALAARLAGRAVYGSSCALRRMSTKVASGTVRADLPAGGEGQHGFRGALFTDQAALYAAFRPNYPPELFELIYRAGGGDGAAPAASCHELAVDVATGSGQVAVELCKVYARVIACDSSPGQLEHAVQRPNIEYVQVGAAPAPLCYTRRLLGWRLDSALPVVPTPSEGCLGHVNERRWGLGESVCALG